MKPLLLLPLFALHACSDAPNKPYVLVHGAWMGGDGWDPVADQLRDAGASVRTFDLPAHGGDQTPVSGATLAGYVERVEAELDAVGEPVILVGHSMAGIVITQVAENRADDIASLVYIGAYVPANGQSLLDLDGIPRHRARRAPGVRSRRDGRDRASRVPGAVLRRLRASGRGRADRGVSRRAGDAARHAGRDR